MEVQWTNARTIGGMRKLFPFILSHKIRYSACLVWPCFAIQDENTGCLRVKSFGVNLKAKIEAVERFLS